jgi:hypothetical protein
MERPQGTPAAGPSADLGLLCAHLRSKKILGSPELPRRVEDALDASNWCWCVRTAQILGPDRAHAHPEDCRVGRGCYLSPLERPGTGGSA